MEHLEDLLLGGSNSIKNAALCGLVFDQPPTYTELVNRTPRLAPLFKLNDQYNKTKSLSVSWQGFEP